jgi:CRP-like cAMP-binding protein
MHEESLILNELSVNLRQEIVDLFVVKTTKEIPLLLNRNEDAVHEIVTKMKPLFFAPEELVIEEGTEGSDLLFIVEGSVAVFSSLCNGPRLMDGKPLDELGKGDFIGEMAIFLEHQQGIRSATVITTNFCDMFSIAREVIEEQVAKDPTLIRDIMKICITREKNTKRRTQQYQNKRRKDDMEKATKWTELKNRMSKRSSIMPLDNVLAMATKELKENHLLAEKHAEIFVKAGGAKAEDSVNSDVTDFEMHEMVEQLCASVDKMQSRLDKLITSSVAKN